MIILRMQHSVTDYEVWKHAFDTDPIDRKGSGVRRYTVYRSSYDPDWVMIDLEFDDVGTAETVQRKLAQLWSGPGREIMHNPESWIVETVDSHEVE